MCASGTALAHPEFSATLTNRYVKLSLLSANELRLAYTVMYGAAPALAARRAADANRDGKLDDAETRALGARLAEEASRGIELTVDGARVTLKFEEPQVGLAGAEVQANPFSIDLIARVPAPGAGAHEVRFDDRTALPELGETEVRIEESPTAQLLAAHRGPTGEERETKFLFRGPKFSALEDRSITFRFAARANPVTAANAATASSSSSSPSARWPWIVGAAIAIVAAVAAALVLRKRRA